MKVYRFMNLEEFYKFKHGEKLENNKAHVGKTNSIGFCFLDLEEYKPEYAAHFLNGAIGNYILEKLVEPRYMCCV